MVPRPCLIGILLPLTLVAQEISPPDLSALEREALAGYPGLEELRFKVFEAERLLPAAAALPDPMVELDLTLARFPRWTLGKEEMSMAGFSLQQALGNAKTRHARQLVAKATAQVARAELAALRALVLLRLRQTYAQLYRLDQELAILEEASKLFSTLEGAAHARYMAGLTHQESVIRVLVQSVRLAEQRADLQRERRQVAAALDRWVGKRQGSTLAVVSQLPKVELDPTWSERALHQAPTVQVAEAEVAAAAEEVGLAEAERRPNLFLSGGLASRGSFGPVARLALGLEWPAWRQQKQDLQLVAARLRLKAAQAKLQRVRGEVEEEVQRTAAAWQVAQAQEARYRHELVPLAEAALAAAQTAFTAGQVDFSAVLEDFNLWLEARAGLIRRQAELFALWAEARYFSGDHGGDG
ncbi:MAG: TolC family protein [Thermoanaerobaculum sp.]|nr:TolC family protein [Thermoanaerobaculum sp.]MDW7968358.1 TolC family protein [Thermoanaerobaculum sp.]